LPYILTDENNRLLQYLTANKIIGKREKTPILDARSNVQDYAARLLEYPYDDVSKEVVVAMNETLAALNASIAA
jgi:hypothetical protein